MTMDQRHGSMYDQLRAHILFHKQEEERDHIGNGECLLKPQSHTS